jgi:hypothetical protein
MLIVFCVNLLALFDPLLSLSIESWRISATLSHDALI